jgi:hypothetical protein
LRRQNRGTWILALVCSWVLLSPFIPVANAIDSNALVFAYDTATVYQEVNVSTAGKSELTLSVSAAETQDWVPSSDLLNIGIALYGAGGGLIYQHSTGNIAIDSGQFADYSISVSEAGVGAGGWSVVTSARAFIIGQDGEFWAGNYGTRVESASLKFNDNVELLSNTEFTSTNSWTSTIGWQTCSGGSGNKPCVNIAALPTTTTTTTTTTIPTNNSQYSLGNDMVWGTANEGWNLSLSAPGGGVFTEVIFASYGNPSGNNGVYTQNWCHATNSIQKVSEIFIGNSSGTISANNGVFGDPCGGTYKNLRVVLKYVSGLPNTTTTTTTTLPTCGPYSNLTVTGALNGAVWGSGPYTDDSDFGVAAVHAGLAEVGETVTLVPSNIAYHPSYPGSTANGVTTSDWPSGWCGYDIGLQTPPTTTTTTTTTTLPETTTTEQETTTTTEVEPETTVPETTTTIDSPSTGTTIEETTTTTEPEQEPEATTTTIAIPDEPVEDNIEETTTQPEEPDGAESIQDTETTVPEPAPDTEDEAPQDANNEVVEVTAENLEDVLSGEITSEVLDSVVDALESGDIELTPEVAEAVVSAITSEDATEEQIIAAVELLIESGQLSSGVAEELATSPQVLESITGNEASEIFDAVSVSDLTEDASEEIINAVQEAPTEVREAFETEINVFGGKFDTYVPVGSTISVAERRTVVAATVVSSLMVVTSAAAAPPAPSQPTGGGGGSSGGGPASTEPSDSGKPRRRRGGG